jgi:tetratricopeptide (TPR) repeat protein
LEKAPLLLLSAGSAAVTLSYDAGGWLGSLDSYPPGLRAANALVSYAAYLVKTAWPSSLSIFYPYPSGGLPAWKVAGSGLLLVLLTGAAVLQARRRPWLAVGWFWYLGMLVPVIGLVQAGGQAMADRFTYLPLVGVFIAAVWGIADVAPRSRPWTSGLAAASVLALVALLAVARLQTRHWSSNESLFRHAARVTPDNWVAHYNLGVALAETYKFEEATRNFQEVLRIVPDHADSHYNLGTILLEQGKVAEAVMEYRKAIQAAPGDLQLRRQIDMALSAIP